MATETSGISGTNSDASLMAAVISAEVVDLARSSILIDSGRIRPPRPIAPSPS